MAKTQRDLYLCQSCGLRDRRVECVGIFHCPNPLCNGSGGAWFRHRLASCRNLPNGKHTINEQERREKGFAYIESLEDKGLRDVLMRVAFPELCIT